MLFNWWRKRTDRTKKQHRVSQRRRLAFERLEERCLPSAKTISSGAACLLLPDQQGNNLPTFALSADNGRLAVAPSIVHDGSEFGNAHQAEAMQATGDSSQQAPMQHVLTTQLLEQHSQNGASQDSDNTLTDHPQGPPTSGGGNRFSGNSDREVNVLLTDVVDLNAVQVSSGPKDSFVGGTNLQSNGVDVGSRPISSGSARPLI
jgi:hypothetical protein